MAIEFNKNKYYMSEDALLRRVEYLTDRTIDEHIHDFIEIVYILKGKCVHVVDNNEYKLRHGDVLVINYDSVHSIKAESGLEHINILLKPRYINYSLEESQNIFDILNLSEFKEFTEILDKNKSKISFSGEERDRIEVIIAMLADEIEQKHSGYELAVYSQFNVLLLMIFRKMGIDFDDTFDGMSDKLLNYIKRHCSEKLTMDDFAKRCAYNPSYFSRLFKEYTGLSFMNYLKKVRMEKAIDMVKNSNLNITDIVYALGYSDTTKFFKHFREYTGTTPLKLRKSKK